MKCVWEKGRSMKFLFMGKLLVIWRRGDYCPWQQFEQLGGTAHHRVPWSHSGFGDPYVSSAFIWAIFSSILFPLLDNLCSRTRFYSLLVCDSYNPKKWVTFEEFGSSQFVQIIQCLATLHITAVPSFRPWGQRAQRKPLPERSGFTGWLKIFYVCWVHSLRCFSTCAECGKDKHLRKTFPCHYTWLM